ncbi:MAG: hypothetical protein AB2563_17780 [Candidatus Thiodiazotropha endolucinida]
MKEYIFDLQKTRSLNDWWDEYINIVRGEGFEYFGKNRDAYSDSIDGGPGCPEYPCRFVFINKGKITNPQLIEYTKIELEFKKTKCHPSWLPTIEAQLELLEKGIGENLHHWIIDPLMGREGIEVVVK